MKSYDAGPLGVGGGGDVEWWHDYMQVELAQSAAFYETQFEQERDQLKQRVAELEKALRDIINQSHGEGTHPEGRIARAALTKEEL